MNTLRRLLNTLHRPGLWAYAQLTGTPTPCRCNQPNTRRKSK